MHLQDIETDCLLRGIIAFDDDVALGPFSLPGRGMIGKHPVETLHMCGIGGGCRHGIELIGGMMERRDVGHVFEEGGGLTHLHGCFYTVSGVEFVLRYFRFQVLRRARDFERTAHGRSDAESGLLGFTGDERCTLAGRAADLDPKTLVVVGVLVEYVQIQIRGKRNRPSEAQRSDRVADRSAVRIDDADEAVGPDFDAFSGRQFRHEATFEECRFHVEHAGEGFHLRRRQIELLTVNGDIDSDPVGGVENFGEVFWVAVLPPADTGFIRIVNAGHIAPAQGFAAVFLLEIGTLTHLAVSD